MMLHLQPITRAEAFDFIKKHHRHLPPPPGGIFQIGINNGAEVVGVLLAGRPVARMSNDGYTVEISRCCVLEGYKNACSKLYGAAWRAAKALGYRKIQTYTLNHEGGGSMRGAGFSCSKTCLLYTSPSPRD